MTDKPIPMTREEEYRNADVPMPEEDDRGDLDLTKMIEVQQKEIRNLVKDNQLLIAEIDRLRGQIERLKNLNSAKEQAEGQIASVETWDVIWKWAPYVATLAGSAGVLAKFGTGPFRALWNLCKGLGHWNWAIGAVVLLAGAGYYYYISYLSDILIIKKSSIAYSGISFL